MSRNDYFAVRDAYLAHYGIKGMKWRFHKAINRAKLKLNGMKIRQFIKDIPKNIRIAGHYIKSKYNPSAFVRSKKRSNSINDLYERTKAHSISGSEKYGNVYDTRVRSYRVNLGGKRTLTNDYNRYGTDDYSTRLRGVGKRIKKSTKKTRW